jgi:hypothetical protein
MLNRWEAQILSTPQFVELPATDAPLTQTDSLLIEMSVGAIDLKVSGCTAELVSFIAKLAERQR